jgi:glutamine phosphoribosylpyrophosphate amidotransferase
MSGIGHAIGYPQRSGIRYQEVFIYNRYADRSCTQSTQHAREKMAKRKLSVLRYAVENKTGDILTMAKLRELEVWMAGEIGADSLKYNSIDAFVTALGLPREDLCLKCWDGIIPLVDRSTELAL